MGVSNETELSHLTGHWTAQELWRSCPAIQEGEDDYQREAKLLAKHGYWAEEDWSGSDISVRFVREGASGSRERPLANRAGAALTIVGAVIGVLAGPFVLGQPLSDVLFNRDTLAGMNSSAAFFDAAVWSTIDSALVGALLGALLVAALFWGWRRS